MKLRSNVTTALLTAVLCITAPVMIPAGPIPVSLATLGVYLAAGLLGPWRGTTAVGLYLLLGSVGVPVFAGYVGGFPQLLGPTGGFLWGYLLCALFIGVLCRLGQRWLIPVGLAAGAVVLYTLGCGWFALQTGTSLWVAVVTCVTPCLIGELVKIAVATGLILSLRGRVGRLLTNGIKEQRL